MKLYSFDDITQAGDCVRFASEVLGLKVNNSRCRAAWRGGDNDDMVHLEKDKWFDHKVKEGGGLIKLCAISKFNGNIQLAQDFLGDWLKLTPKLTVQKRKPQFLREKMLKDSGYTEVKRYVYTDENGNAAHMTIRFEKPGAKKEFVQRTEDNDNLDGVRTYLYNLPAVIKADTVVIAEGEKDADTLINWGVCGTTAPMGAMKWDDRYTESLRGKHVVICRDRDDAGLAHAKILVRHLTGAASDIKVLCPWKEAKDVTEWAEIEGGNAIKLSAIIAASKPVNADTMLENDDEERILKAKEANLAPFSNVVKTFTEVDGETEEYEDPKPLGEILDDMHTRFLGFPCKIGDSQLFDHDRDTNRIEVITKPSDLIAWISIKSGHSVDWAKSRGAITKDELYSGAIFSARRYDSISQVPDWPKRDTVYYAYREHVKPTKDCSAFNGLLDFFSPANEETRILLRVFFAAPLFYRYGIQRPCWVIDSRDGPGVGKTTLVELLATLYKCSPIKATQADFKNNYAELLGNIVSDGGRTSRILLVDNASGDFRDPNFAELVTCFGVSCRPKYGRCQETRPNDLTCCITVNNAQLSDEIASRSFMLLMRRPEHGASSWKSQVLSYIEANRWGIFGDMMSILNNGRPFDDPTRTRVPEFEREVMMPMCGTAENYRLAITGIASQREDSNVDMDLAKQCEETISIHLAAIRVAPDDNVVFIRSEVLAAWIKPLGVIPAKLKEFAATGLLPCISNNPKNSRYPRNSKSKDGIPMRRGLMWMGKSVGVDSFSTVVIVGRTSTDDSFGVVGSVIGDDVITEELAMRIPQEPIAPRSTVDQRILDSLDEFPVIPAVPGDD